MGEQKKGNRVTWASGANLTQVKYFHVAESPSKVGQQTCQLEASHSYHVVSDCGSANANLLIPQVQWRTPPEFVLRSDWHVAAGEESKEREVKKRRETRVLEEVYPRLSAVPRSPLVSSDVEGKFYDDRRTPIVPIIPVEEREAMDLSSLETAPSNISISSLPENQHQGPPTPAILSFATSMSVLSPKPSNNGKSAISYGSQSKPAFATAAAAANAILKSKESGSLIDADLLFKLLKNPEMTQKLIDEHQLSSQVSTAAVPLPSSQLLIDQSDTKNSKPADAGAEVSRRPQVIKLSSSADVKTGTPYEPSLSLMRSTNDFLIKSSSHDYNQPASRGNVAATQMLEHLLAANTRIGTGSRLKHVMPLVPRTSSCDVLSSKSTRNQPVSSISHIVTKPVQQSLATIPQTGTFSQPRQVALPVTLSSSAPSLLSKQPTNVHGELANNWTVAMLKPVAVTGYPPNTCMLSVSSSEHNQQVNTEKVMVSKAVTQSVAKNTGSQTGFTTKTGIPPVSLPSLVHHVPGKISINGQNQQVNTGNVVVPQSVVTQFVAANTGTGTEFRIKTTTPPVSLPSLVHDFPSKRSINEQNQQVDAGNVVLPKPVVTQSVAGNAGNGMGSGTETVTPPWFFLTPRPYTLGNISSNEQYQPARTEGVAVPRPPMPSLAANSANGIGFRPIAVTPSIPFQSSVPDFRFSTLPSRPSRPVAENQPPSLSRINSELLGTPPNFGSSPVHSMGPNPDISRLKKLIDEHGAHFQGGNASVSGISPPLPNPSKPDWDMLRKLINEHGSSNNLESPLPGSGPQLAPSSVETFHRPQEEVPPGENWQPQLHTPSSFRASLYAAPATPQLKDMRYQQSVIKHQNRDNGLLQQNNPQNYLQGSEVAQSVHIMGSQQNIHKPCIYYSSSTGCRNGSRCRFQHELLKPWRSGGVLEAPNAKRMKPGGEFTG